MKENGILLYHDFEPADVERAEVGAYVNFIVSMPWRAAAPGGLLVLEGVATDAARWLRDFWGVRSARVPQEAIWIRVRREDADEANRGLAMFCRYASLEVGFAS